jgi:hypothetical protein
MNSSKFGLRRGLGACLAAFFLVSCGDSDPILFSEPAQIEAVSSLSQEGVVAQAVTETPRVRVTDARGNPSPGALVTFEAREGGEVSTRQVEADAQGFASPGSWTLGTQARTYRLLASAPDLATVEFTALARAGAADSLRATRGQGVFGTVGAPLEILPQVTVTDEYGNPVQGVAVTFHVLSGGGTLQGATAISDSAGRASPAGWTLGTAAGSQSIEARSEGLSPVTFTVTATAAQPDTIEILSFEAPSPVVGQTLPPIRLQVRDEFGNPAVDQPLQAQVLLGGGSVSPTAPRTDAAGQVELLWTLGPVVGLQRMEVRSGTRRLALFEVQAAPGPVDRLVPVQGQNQLAPPGEPVPVPPGVRAVDAFGNPIAGIAVSFQVTAGGGSIQGSPATTGADGVAKLTSWTLGPVPGENRVVASHPGLDPVTFIAQAVETELRVLEVIEGEGQTAAIGFPVSVPPAVRLTTSTGVPVQGAEVTFTVIEGGGTAEPSAVTTDAAGEARLESWVMGPTAGTNRIRVDADNAASVTIMAQGVDGFQVLVHEVHLNQGSQTFPASIPVLADRGGLLRVFLKANEVNEERPDVRVLLYDGNIQVSDETITRLIGSVPVELNPDLGSASWSLRISPEMVRPGLGMRVIVDPGEEVDMVDRAPLIWPSDGTIHRPDVRQTPPFRATFIRIMSTVHNTTGDVNEGNLSDYMRVTRDFFPIGNSNAIVRPQEMVTNAGPLDGPNAGPEWEKVLQEVFALRLADAQSDPQVMNRYYHGIVRRPGGAGIAGIAYVATNPFSNALAAVSFDAVSARSEVVAHEFGHNFGRRHAPCGIPAGDPSLDPGYPYAGAVIGVTGYNYRTSSLIRSDGSWRDIMSYCDPAWSSDYTFDAVLAMREARPAGAPGADLIAAAADGILVWGDWSSTRGPRLHPAVEMSSRPFEPVNVNARVFGYADDGSLLFDLGVEGLPVDHADDRSTHHFQRFVPLTAEARVRLARIVLESPEGVVELGTTAGPAAAPSAAPLLELDVAPGAAPAPGVGSPPVRVRWNADDYPLAVLRDELSGRVISFARGGEIVIPRPGGEALQVQLSDGVRTLTQRVTLP